MRLVFSVPPGVEVVNGAGEAFDVGALAQPREGQQSHQLGFPNSEVGKQVFYRPLAQYRLVNQHVFGQAGDGLEEFFALVFESGKDFGFVHFGFV